MAEIVESGKPDTIEYPPLADTIYGSSIEAIPSPDLVKAADRPAVQNSSPDQEHNLLNELETSAAMTVASKGLFLALAVSRRPWSSSSLLRGLWRRLGQDGTEETGADELITGGIQTGGPENDLMPPGTSLLSARGASIGDQPSNWWRNAATGTKKYLLCLPVDLLHCSISGEVTLKTIDEKYFGLRAGLNTIGERYFGLGSETVSAVPPTVAVVPPVLPPAAPPAPVGEAPAAEPPVLPADEVAHAALTPPVAEPPAPPVTEAAPAAPPAGPVSPLAEVRAPVPAQPGETPIGGGQPLAAPDDLARLRQHFGGGDNPAEGRQSRPPRPFNFDRFGAPEMKPAEGQENIGFYEVGSGEWSRRYTTTDGHTVDETLLRGGRSRVFMRSDGQTEVFERQGRNWVKVVD